ncbi:MAG TPA: prepilin peptidase, partial [Actinomycetota bacterium]|nr:prepilin peptidase [Actinomycetota bacterium]
MTVVIARVPAGESVLHPRSKCPKCGAELRDRDNIPVLGWALLRGRCRGCGERISVS